MREARAYILKFIDDLITKCKVEVGKSYEYDLSQHKVIVQEANTRAGLISGWIQAIVMNLVPGAKRVVYKGHYHILMSYKDVDIMAGKILREICPYSSLSSWFRYLDTKYKYKEKIPPGPKPNMISRDQLSYLYYDKKMTLEQIRELLGCNIDTVKSYMRRYKLIGRKSAKIYISPEKLASLYYDQDFTQGEIAQILGVSRRLINTRMKELGFKARDTVYLCPIQKMAVKAFRSVLRKKFRRNPIYIKIAREVVERAEKDPDLYMYEEPEDKEE